MKSKGFENLQRRQTGQKEDFKMIELIKTMFSYDFMVQAVVVGLLVTLCASLLGVSMVLKDIQ